ncbi:MAG: GIY-YIG nuclease family protein [Rubrobacteraceae bacterium]
MNGPTARPTSIRIFLADGTPEGIRIVEKSNWTGRAVVAGRAQLTEALRRDEMTRPGVYVLVGSGESGNLRIYVGEADVLSDRLKQHAIQKDFWVRFVAFTSTDQNLNKAHVRYLESRLVALAKSANQWEIENRNIPAEPSLSEADRADADWFLDEMLVIYPILGIDAFESAAAENPPAEGEQELTLSQRGAEGKGRETKDGFVVLSGSRARATETKSIHNYMRELRQQLLDREVLALDGKHLVFLQDFRFASPSTAAGVLVGGAANGRMAWKATDGRTLKSIQDARTEVVT